MSGITTSHSAIEDLPNYYNDEQLYKRKNEILQQIMKLQNELSFIEQKIYSKPRLYTLKVDKINLKDYVGDIPWLEDHICRTSSTNITGIIIS